VESRPTGVGGIRASRLTCGFTKRPLEAALQGEARMTVIGQSYPKWLTLTGFHSAKWVQWGQDQPLGSFSVAILKTSGGIRPDVAGSSWSALAKGESWLPSEAAWEPAVQQAPRAICDALFPRLRW
jgi:hypothetical protein